MVEGERSTDWAPESKPRLKTVLTAIRVSLPEGEPEGAHPAHRLSDSEAVPAEVLFWKNYLILLMITDMFFITEKEESAEVPETLLLTAETER